MPVQNPSFEQAGAAPGEALGWTLVVHATAEAIAAYGAARPEAVERFEVEWAGNEGFAFAFEDFTHVRATFTPTGDAVEAFDQGWRSNESFIVGLTDGANALPAVYAADPVEAFEGGWLSNEAFLFVLDPNPTAIAPYATAGGPTPHEAFESLWRANEAFATSLGQLIVEAAAYQTSGILAPRETFEDDFPTVMMTTL